MRVIPFPDWDTRDVARTDRRRDPGPGGEREFIGVAIGPRSDESVVEVDGFELQAGRVLALSARDYTIKRVRPRSGFIPVKHLELVCFEHPGELATETARPNRRYSGNATILDTQFGSVTVPFCGRREAKIMITTNPNGGNTAPVFDYEVIGFSWIDSLGTAMPWGMRNEVAPVLQRPSLTQAGGVLTPGGLYEYSFYTGGTDNGEAWDSLMVRIHNRAGETHQYFVDVVTIGEMGAR